MLSDAMIRQTLKWIEAGYIPTPIIRWGSRKLCHMQLKRDLINESCEVQQQHLMDFKESTHQGPIAPVPDKANEQHYELPPRFFELCLGEHRKYSGCYWDKDTQTLSQAEVNALKRSCEHAEIRNGQQILELGCGWGSLTLWMAAHYPDSQITAVSNSNPQREFIEGLAQKLKLDNIKVITCDMNDFEIDQQFDRVVSIEMFEHMRNYELLLSKIASWLHPEGKLFVHIFTHQTLAYPYIAANDEDFIAKHFFTGGIMPSDHFLLYFQDHMRIQKHWRWDGTHYQKTANAWLKNMDNHKSEIMSIFKSVYGSEARKWFNRWRVFYIACAELWGYEQGKQWMVSHYLFEKRKLSEKQHATTDSNFVTTLAPAF